jgi:Cohesin domain
MKKYLISKLLAAFLFCYIQSGYSAVLSVQMPNGGSTFNTTVGTVFDAKILINTVSDFAGFDFNLAYDSTKLTALSLTSGNIFGADDSEVFVNSITPGSVKYAEAIAADSPALAGLNLNAPTLLATVQFRALVTGVNSLLDITNPILSDFNGDSIAGTKQGAFVTITPAAVPLPASLFLFLPGLFAVFGQGKKKAKSEAIIL